jgi:hypothetical protein
MLLNELRYGGFDAIVSKSSGLVVEMGQRVPLRRALRVKFDLSAKLAIAFYFYRIFYYLVVKSLAVQRTAFKSNNFVHQSFSPKSRRFDRINGPTGKPLTTA